MMEKEIIDMGKFDSEIIEYKLEKARDTVNLVIMEYKNGKSDSFLIDLNIFHNGNTKLWNKIKKAIVKVCEESSEIGWVEKKEKK